MSYATDGLCHNANYGTYGHECGRPAEWLADKPSTLICDGVFTSGFCDLCKREGDEARGMVNWRRIKPAETISAGWFASAFRPEG